MEYGDRVLIPSGFSWGREYLEMRRFGPFHETILPAVLFRLIESAYPFEATENLPAMVTLKKICTDNSFLALAHLVGNLMHQRSIQKTQLWGYLMHLLQLIVGRAPFTPFDVEGNLHIMSAICGLTFCDANRSSHEDSADISYVVDNSNTVFLLYRHLSRESFLNFSCGHSGVKLHCYKQLQCAAGNRALTFGELWESCSILCPQCEVPVQSEVIAACAEQPAPQATQSGMNSCYICKRELGSWSECRRHLLCIDCIVQNYFQETAMKVPCCLERDLSDDAISSVLSVIESRPDLLSLAVRLPHYKQRETLKNQYSADSRGSQAPMLQRTDDNPLIQSQPSGDNRNGRILQPARSEGSGATDPLGVDSSGAKVSNKGSLFAAKQPAVKVQYLSHCYTCNSPFTESDSGYQCRSQCQCKICTVETLIGRRMLECLRCHGDFPSNAVKRIDNQFKRCHVCGIAVSEDFIAAHVPCRPCLSCIMERDVSGGNTLGKCIDCPGGLCMLRAKEVAGMREMWQIGTACCERADGPLRETVLRCGHAVCKIHRATLLVCRKCRQHV